MAFRVRNQSAIFTIVVLAVTLIGLALALHLGNWYQYPPVMIGSDVSDTSAFKGDLWSMADPEAIPVAASVGSDHLHLLARIIQAEAEGEPYLGKVAVGAVVLNRVRHSSFPNNIPGVVFQPRAFEPVANGRIWRPVHQDSYRAARHALAGWDPTYGALYFWNPVTARSPWVWTRNIITRIGKHVFAR